MRRPPPISTPSPYTPLSRSYLTPPAMSGGHGAHEGQAQAHAVEVLVMVQALERLAQPGDGLPIHAGPVVPDGDAAMACVLPQQALHRGGGCLICARSVLDGGAAPV